MTTIGFIGSGNIGGTVARLAIAGGYDVVLSNSRGPETLVDLVQQLGDHARAGTSDEAAAEGDLVLVSVPLQAVRELPAKPLAGKVVMDTVNYYPQRDGHVAELDDESITTSELVARHLPGALVVKVFNNIAAPALGTLTRPSGAADRTALPIAGDDASAKETVVSFLDDIGYDAVDAGPLAEGWRFQRHTAAYATPYFGPGGREDPRPLSADELRARLGEAVRYRDMDG
jgi:predicted dinucleotide-binding enzyme